MQITQFDIVRLHGRIDIRVPIKDNKIILIGVNGSGKSTVINLMYYFLSRQFVRLLDYRFESLTLVIDHSPITLQRSSLESLVTKDVRWSNALRAAILKDIPSLTMGKTNELNSLLKNNEYLTTWSSKLAYQSVQSVPSLLDLGFLDIGENSNQSHKGLLDTITVAKESLESKVTSDILFFPTYRRIEKDLQTLVPELKAEIDRVLQRDTRNLEGAGRSFIEFVHFGMEDVELNINTITAKLKESSLTEFKNLAGMYLHDVITDTGKDFEQNDLKYIRDTDINRIIDRIQEEAFSLTYKESLKNAIVRIKSRGVSDISENDRYVAHFFSLLIKLDKRIRDQEMHLVKFCEMCNSYLVDKELHYDDRLFKLTVRTAYKAREHEDLDFSTLSSGEKQIVSVFSHLYLANQRQMAFIIDEPELSLSVDWQSRILPDILNARKVSFLAVVTHSPFIYDNFLQEFVVDLSECVTS